MEIKEVGKNYVVYRCHNCGYETIVYEFDNFEDIYEREKDFYFRYFDLSNYR